MMLLKQPTLMSRSRYFSKPKKSDSLPPKQFIKQASLAEIQDKHLHIKTKCLSIQKTKNQIKSIEECIQNKKNLRWVNFSQETKKLKNLTSKNKHTNFIVSKKKYPCKRYHDLQTCTSSIELSKQGCLIDYFYDTYKGTRDYNEDRIQIATSVKIKEDITGSIFAVFDGHGGSTVAQYLKLNLIKTFQKKIIDSQPQNALRETLLDLETNILKMGVKINSGSCAIVCLLIKDNYYIANVGDSRALLIKGESQFQQISIDHKPNCPRERERIEKNGGTVYRSMKVEQSNGSRYYGPFRVEPGKISVSRTIGDYPIKKQSKKAISSEPQLFTGKLLDEQILLLFSDGAYQQFSNQQISILFSNPSYSLPKKIKNFIKKCVQRQTNDNTSIIAIQKNALTKMITSVDTITYPFIK